MKILKYISIALLTMFFGCSLDEPSKTSTTLDLGDADFTRYVAIGNSLTAGYQSGALTEERQLKSFPMQIATQAGVGATFAQPLLGYPGIGTYSGDPTYAGILELTYLDNPSTDSTINPDPVITPEPFASHTGTFDPTMPWATSAIRDYPAPYNNLGIPGSILGQIQLATSAATSSSDNKFFDIILRNAVPDFGNSNVVEQAGLLSPTFITCWIGNNDVLGYATSGGTKGTDQATGTLPTDVPTFTFLYGQLLDSLQALGADIVVANIPDVTAIPFFTTIPPYLLNPKTNDLLLVNGAPVPLVGVTPGADLVLLTASSALKQGLGVPVTAGGTGSPLPDNVVLDAAEIAIASQAVADFNSAIATLAGARNIPVVDINSFFNNVQANGYNSGGLVFTTDFLTGNLFSLDGVHPTSAGYSIIANQFIMKINESFNASIPLVNITDQLAKRDININSIQFHEDAFKNVVSMFSGR